MRRNLRFVMALIKLKLKREMSFRASFFAASFVDGSMFLLWLAMFGAIYSSVDAIGGWGRGEMTVFLGTYSMLNALNMTVYFFGVISISAKIRTGELDHYLTKPANALLRLSLENVNLGSAPLIVLSAAIIAYGARTAGLAPDAQTLLLYALLTLLMCVLYYDLELILRTIPFFVISASSIERFEGAAFDVCMRVPGDLFKRGFRLLFCGLLPYGILATVPARVLTGAATAAEMLWAAALTVAFTAFALKFWKFGLRHYKSASS